MKKKNAKKYFYIFSSVIFPRCFSYTSVYSAVGISLFVFSDCYLLGIGYFVLPYLLKANAKKVIACEWNPDAVLALSHNLVLNNVNNRCEIRQGDNRNVSDA